MELFYHAKQSATDALKTASKKQFENQQKQLVIWLVIKLQIQLQKSKKLHHRQLKVKRKYLNRYTSPEEIQKTIDELRLIQ